MLAFWQLIISLFAVSFCPCVYLLQHYCRGGPVARDSPYVCGRWLLWVHVTGTTRKWQRKQSLRALSYLPPSLPPSLHSLLSICSQVLENLWPYMPLTHSQTAYWYHVCVMKWDQGWRTHYTQQLLSTVSCSPDKIWYTGIYCASHKYRFQYYELISYFWEL